MHINNTWIKCENGILINLKWMLQWRLMTGLNLSPKYIDREIELSKGNMKWDDGSEHSVLDTSNYTARTIELAGAKYSIVSTDENRLDVYRTSFDNYSDIKIETDFDDKINKINRRLQLIGESKCMGTNGTYIFSREHCDRVRDVHQLENNALVCQRNDTNIPNNWRLNVDNSDFVSLNSVYYIDEITLESTKEDKHLAYISGESNIINIGSNITIEEAAGINLSLPCNIKRIDRCMIDLNRYTSMRHIDLSDLEYIDQLLIKDDIESSKHQIHVIDFKDSKPILNKDSASILFDVSVCKVLVTSRDRDTFEILKRSVETGISRDRVTVDYTGE